MFFKTVSSPEPKSEGTIEISPVEEKILKITQNQKINSQLVYGLYPELIPDIESMQQERDGSHSPVSSNEYVKNEGMSILGLNREQVETPNFGYHTISVIQNEMKISKTTLNDAFAKYAGLTNIQISAMTDLGLTREQVTTPNFGYHTISVIQNEMKISKATLNDAFAKYAGLTNIQISAMTDLGLTREQVTTPNFGYHTISVIQNEMKISKGTLNDAFAKYAGLTNIQISAMTDPGLTREQVTTPNFGYHTIQAIQNEMKISKVTSNNAFEKYAGLTTFQIQAMTDLGLNHNQVTSANFGFHTIQGVDNIRKRRPELSSVEAFELIGGKSEVDTQSFLFCFLSNTRKDQKPISEMRLIRVIVNPGRGFGHQRAAITLMQKLREIGFKGTFDILCDDGLGRMLTSEETLKPYINREPLVSGKLIGMISGFQASKLNSEQVSFVPELGAIKISSLPHDYLHNPDLRLSKVDLAVCAADDRNDSKAILKIGKFNSELYIGLQPTDWLQGRSFVIDQDGIATNLQPSSVTRLSSSATYNNSKPNFVVATKDTSKGSEESKEHRSTTAGLKMKKSGNVDEAIEMRRIVEANTLLSRKTGKPVIVLVPQKIALDNDFIKKVKAQDNNIHFFDLTQNNIDISKYKTGDIIVAYTGRLNQAFFDYLMLQGTTLPSVIEGCNSQELCESSGKSFIHGSGKFTNLKQYPVMLTAKQKLHTEASLCLEQGDPKYLLQLTQYMSESLQSSGQLTEYHQQRRENFLDRPDACKLACDTLKIAYKESQVVVRPHVKKS